MRRDIWEALIEHKNMVIATGIPESQILGVFLYGSQNYGVDTENSDVDTKCIVIPTFDELIFNRPISKQLEFENGEHCEIKDIREMVANFKKQNINFVEVLFTKHFWLNPLYEEIWNKHFIAAREDIARYDVNRAVQSICGQAIHTLKQNPEDGKKVSNGYRLYYFLQQYTGGNTYINCIVPPFSVRDSLMEFKLNKKSKETNKVFANELLEKFEEMRKNKYIQHEALTTLAEYEMNKGTKELIVKLMEVQ